MSDQLVGNVACAFKECNELRQRLADAERRNVDQSNYLREALKRINVNQHHAFCLALADLLTKPEEAKSCAPLPPIK